MSFGIRTFSSLESAISYLIFVLQEIPMGIALCGLPFFYFVLILIGTICPSKSLLRF